MKYWKIVFAVLVFSLGYIQEDTDLVLNFHEGSSLMVKKDVTGKGEEFLYYYHIERISKKYVKYIEPIIFEPISEGEILSTDDNTRTKDINWLRDEYVQAFDNFSGKYPGVNADGTLRELDLKNQYDRIFLLEKDGEKLIKTQVKRVFIEENH